MVRSDSDGSGGGDGASGGGGGGAGGTGGRPLKTAFGRRLTTTGRSGWAYAHPQATAEEHGFHVQNDPAAPSAQQQPRRGNRPLGAVEQEWEKQRRRAAGRRGTVFPDE